MKNKIIVCIIAFVLLWVGVYFVYDNAFPKAKKVDYPHFSAIDSISIMTQDSEKLDISEDFYETIYKYISNAKPTRKKSVNDAPYADTYYAVFIESDDIPWGRGYIYEVEGKYYFEIPYVGIYDFGPDVFKWR